MTQKPYVGHEFEALKLRYEDQVGLLRALTEIDFKLFTSFFTLQLLLGSFLLTQSSAAAKHQASLAIVDAVLAILSVKLLYNNHRRRQEVGDTIGNLNAALGFTEPGVYLEGRPLNPPYQRRYWFKWYAVGVAVATCGVLMVLLAK